MNMDIYQKRTEMNEVQDIAIKFYRFKLKT